MSKIIQGVILVCTLFFGNLTTVHASELTGERIIEIVEERYKAFGLEAPYPHVYLAEADHWSVEGFVIGRAVVDKNGKEYIFIQSDTFGNNEDIFTAILDHEISHVMNWRLNGVEATKRRPHGREFIQICRRHAADPSVCRSHVRFN